MKLPRILMVHFCALALSLALAVLMAAGAHASTRPWIDMASSYNAAGNMPRARHGHSMTNVGPLVYVVGGRYSDAQMEWDVLYKQEKFGDAVKWNGLDFEYNLNRYGVGIDVIGPVDLSVLTYDVQAGVWSSVETFDSPNGRWYHAAAAINGTLYVHGGKVMAGTSTLVDCSSVDLAATQKDWVPGWCTGGPGARYGHSLTSMNDKLYMFGGALTIETTMSVSPYLQTSLLKCLGAGHLCANTCGPLPFQACSAID